MNEEVKVNMKMHIEIFVEAAQLYKFNDDIGKSLSAEEGTSIIYALKLIMIEEFLQLVMVRRGWKMEVVDLAPATVTFRSDHHHEHVERHSFAGNSTSLSMCEIVRRHYEDLT
jgi:hypothetical protein